MVRTGGVRSGRRRGHDPGCVGRDGALAGSVAVGTASCGRGGAIGEQRELDQDCLTLVAGPIVAKQETLAFPQGNPRQVVLTSCCRLLATDTRRSGGCFALKSRRD